MVSHLGKAEASVFKALLPLVVAVVKRLIAEDDADDPESPMLDVLDLFEQLAYCPVILGLSNSLPPSLSLFIYILSLRQHY